MWLYPVSPYQCKVTSFFAKSYFSSLSNKGPLVDKTTQKAHLWMPLYEHFSSHFSGMLAPYEFLKKPSWWIVTWHALNLLAWRRSRQATCLSPRVAVLVRQGEHRKIKNCLCGWVCFICLRFISLKGGHWPGVRSIVLPHGVGTMTYSQTPECSKKHLLPLLRALGKLLNVTTFPKETRSPQLLNCQGYACILRVNTSAEVKHGLVHGQDIRAKQRADTGPQSCPKGETRGRPGKREGGNQTIFCHILPLFLDTQREPDYTRLVLQRSRPEHVWDSG